MKVTKYPQSCLLIEKPSGRILIDPGSFAMQKFKWSDFGKIDAVIYTHRHRDHLEPELLGQIKSAEIPIYANTDAAEVVGEEVNVLADGQKFEVAGFQIQAHDLPHFKIEGVQLPQNTGYIIDGTFFHPGDGIETEGVKARDYAAPIAGAFRFDDTLRAARSFQAKRLIPIHYSNLKMYPVDPAEFVNKASQEFEVILLADGESAEL